MTEAKATTNYKLHGVLYSWTAAQTACPAGWHLPSDAEWTILADYLTSNGYGYEGSGDDIAKSMAAQTTWNNSSVVGTPGNDPASNNSSGFNALSGGRCDDWGVFGGFIFDSIGEIVRFWSSTNSGFQYLDYNWPNLRVKHERQDSRCSVRCLRN